MARRLVITIPRAYSVEEAAHELGYNHRSSAYDLIEAGLLRAYPMGGGALRVPADAILEYLQGVVDDMDGTGPRAAQVDAGGTQRDPLRRGARIAAHGGRPRGGRSDG